jgi:hypothetical protein
MTTLLRFVVKQIKEDHIRKFIQETIMPVVNNYLFVDPPPPPMEESRLGFEILGCKTIA